MGKETVLQELLIFRPIEKAFRNIYQKMCIRDSVIIEIGSVILVHTNKVGLPVRKSPILFTKNRIQFLSLIHI